MRPTPLRSTVALPDACEDEERRCAHPHVTIDGRSGAVV